MLETYAWRVIHIKKGILPLGTTGKAKKENGSYGKNTWN